MKTPTSFTLNDNLDNLDDRELIRLKRRRTSSIYSPDLCTNIRGKDIDLIKNFAYENNLLIEFWVMEEYDGIWEWAGGISEKIENDLNSENIDICISGLSPLSERRIGNAQWSLPYYYVQRSILIRRKDYLQNRLKTFEDFAHYDYQSSTITNIINQHQPKNRRTQIGITKGTSAQVDINMRKDPTVDILHIKNQEEAIKKLIIIEEIDGYGSGLPSNQYLKKIWNDAVDRKFDEILSQSYNSKNCSIFQSTLENYIEETSSTIIYEAFQNFNINYKPKDNSEPSSHNSHNSHNSHSNVLKMEEFKRIKENYKLDIIDIHWMDPKEEFCAVINNDSEGLLECFNNYILSFRLNY